MRSSKRSLRTTASRTASRRPSASRRPIIEWAGKGRRPSAYSTPYVLGSGTYGCVIADAVVFPGSHNVKLSTRNKYVTKLAVDAQIEFALAKKIASMVPANVGIFPVDDLQCGITHRDIGHASRKIAQRCEDIFGGLLEKGLYRSASRRSATGRAASSARRPSVPQVCGIQYPRYFCDLHKFITELDYDMVQCLEVAAQLKAKLTALHSVNVLHLDIKDANTALMTNPAAKAPLDARFSDWGFAVIARSTKDINAAIYRTLGPSFKEYYTKVLLPFHVEAPTVNWQPVWDTLIRGSRTEKIDALKMIDRWCLENLIISMIPYAKEQTQYAKDAIKALNRDIAVTFG